MNALRTFWDNFLTSLLNGLPGSAELAHTLLLLTETVIVVTLTLILARRIKTLAGRLLGRSRINPNVIALAGNAVFISVLLLGVGALLKVFDAGWTAILASLSVVTVAIGLAFQDVLKNLIAGVYILLEQPFRIGDQIDVKGVTGEVEGIDIRTTILRTDEGLQVLVPNNIVFTEVVTNRSAYDTRRVVLQLSNVRTAFQDLSHQIGEVFGAFDDIEHIPAPKVTIQKLNDDGTSTVGVEYWQRGAAAILPDVLERLRHAFPDAGITVTSDGTASKVVKA